MFSIIFILIALASRAGTSKCSNLLQELCYLSLLCAEWQQCCETELGRNKSKVICIVIGNVTHGNLSLEVYDLTFSPSFPRFELKLPVLTLKDLLI